MDRSRALVTLVAVISLSIGAIWPNEAPAATAPAVQSLGALQEGLYVPGKLAIDASGNLYVSDARAKKIFKYDASGVLRQTFDSVAVSGRGLTVSADGKRLYAEVDGSVAIIDGVTGARLGDLGGSTPLTRAGDVDIDAAGNVYVVDEAAVKIRVYDAAGGFLRAFSGLGTGDGLFTRITAFAVNAATGEVYVAGEGLGVTNRSVVQIFGLDGQFRSKLALAADFSSPAFNGDLSLCVGIEFDSAGREYYLNVLNGEVRVRDRVTGFQTKLALGGVGAGKVKMPAELAFDGQTNRMFVASDNAKVEIFGVDGGSTPARNQAPAQPQMLAPIAGGEVATLPAELSFVEAFDANGDALTYQVQFSGSPALLNAGASTVVVVPGALTENAAYTWSVQASDGSDVSGFTAAQTFYVNTVQEAPTAPQLLATSAILGGADLLAWQASTDADPGDTVTYQVVVAATADFAAPVLSANTGATQISLNGFADYLALVDGSSYFWQVSAIDNHGVSTVSEIGQFNYDTAVLTVTSNLPDAKVYLGGNAAYPGHLVGTTPFEFRDLAPGLYTVVVEHAGCEAAIAQVNVTGLSNVLVAAELELALAPVLRNAAALRAGNVQIQANGAAAPFVVDFDNDGLDDLLIGDAAGDLKLYRALEQRGAKVLYAAGVSLGLNLQAGAVVPVVVDWNQDNRKDLLVGQNDGSLVLFLQKATSLDNAPRFNAGFALTSNESGLLNAGVGASPVVIDLDADGDMDLVVGNAAGDLLLFANVAAPGATFPVLTDAVLIGHFATAVAPQAADWNADGVRDLLASSAGSLNLLQKGADGLYTSAVALVTVAKDPLARFFVVDTDGGNGKDVFVGTGSGQVELFRSAGKEYLPTVTGALVDKVAQLETLGGDAVQLAAVTTAIKANDLKIASRLVKALAANQLPGELATATAELLALLGR